jgi:DNA invertase Pin-like site-specific DNA recombinase
MISNEKKYVAAYCRVSTDRGEQASSFENQKRFFVEYIEKNPEWKLYEIYADEGKTGTNVKKREAFKRMMRDAHDGKFELILTKEISRFARNILDSISYTRELKHLGVGVCFLNDGIDTREADAELRLAILSSIAQEESRRTSERVKWGQKRRMESGVVFGHSLLGYDVKNGEMTVNEDGANTVRYIFRLFCEEKRSVSEIARYLLDMGISPKGAKIWNPSVILRILKNEKYCGDLVQKKTFTPDYLSHEKKYNHGEEDFIVILNHHTPIISREVFERAQALLSERKTKNIREKHSMSYPFSGKLRCGICGKIMTARVQKRKNGIYHLWRCQGDHTSVSIKNDIVLKMLSLTVANISDEIDMAKEAVKELLSANLAERNTPCAKKLLELYLLGDISKEEYLSEKVRFSKREERLSEMEKALHFAVSEEGFFREIVDFVVVYENRAEVRLKSSERIFSFVISRNGREYSVDLNDIQQNKRK